MMGEYADYAVSDALEMECLRQDYRFGGMSNEEAYERGIVDETGTEISSRRHKRKKYGKGPCPICGGETGLRTGKFGKFYGCLKFPKCKGSRYL
jgi:hypothetical protein